MQNVDIYRLLIQRYNEEFLTTLVLWSNVLTSGSLVESEL